MLQLCPFTRSGRPPPGFSCAGARARGTARPALVGGSSPRPRAAAAWCACGALRGGVGGRLISCAGPSADTPHARPVASSAVSGVAPPLLMRHRRGGPAVVLSGHTHGHTQVSAPSILGLGFIMRFEDFLNSI